MDEGGGGGGGGGGVLLSGAAEMTRPVDRPVGRSLPVIQMVQKFFSPRGPPHRHKGNRVPSSGRHIRARSRVAALRVQLAHRRPGDVQGQLRSAFGVRRSAPRRPPSKRACPTPHRSTDLPTVAAVGRGTSSRSRRRSSCTSACAVSASTARRGRRRLPTTRGAPSPGSPSLRCGADAACCKCLHPHVARGRTWRKRWAARVGG